MLVSGNASAQEATAEGTARPEVIPIPDSLPEKPVTEEEMQRVFDEVKTPFKYGIVIPRGPGEQVD